MIPITRKELYLNKIVGNDDYSVPEKPISEEEFFFAEILGEAVQAPEPLTRYQMYLAKIAGREIEIPYPKVRLEYFLARAAGMEIEAPTPITREEMFWADYALIVEKELSGIPPLTFNAVAGTLKNYRIYGNTVNGESVGDRTANLIQGSIKNANIGNNGKINTSNEFFLVYAPVVTGESYTISNNNGTNVYAFYNAVPSAETATSYDSSRQVFSTSTITFVSPTTGYIAVRLANTAQDIMINPGSTAVPYEPYGYKVPVTVGGKNLVTSYLVAPNGGMRFEPVVFAEVNLQPNTEYLITFTVHENGVKLYSNDLLFTSVYYSSEIQGKKTMRLKTKTSIQSDQHINNKGWVLLRNAKQNPSDFTITDVKLQLVSDAPIYLPEPIKMVGEEAEYIDYAEQKMHRVRKNLWDGEIESGSWMGFNADDEPYKVDYNLRCRSSKLIAVKNSSVYTISNHEPSTNVQVIVQYRDNNKKFINEYGWADFPCTFTTPSNAALIEFIIRKPSNLEIMPEDCGDIQLELGSTATEYEPYIENTDLDVTLPALPTLPGTNVLSVGTAVQPSKVYIKYKGERQ